MSYCPSLFRYFQSQAPLTAVHFPRLLFLNGWDWNAAKVRLHHWKSLIFHIPELNNRRYIWQTSTSVLTQCYYCLPNILNGKWLPLTLKQFKFCINSIFMQKQVSEISKKEISTKRIFFLSSRCFIHNILKEKVKKKSLK